ncbi:hypothetical protein [Amycolatopsis thermoflava]
METDEEIRIFVDGEDIGWVQLKHRPTPPPTVSIRTVFPTLPACSNWSKT